MSSTLLNTHACFIGVGDVNLQNDDSPNNIFKLVASELATADVLYGNLEGPLAGNVHPCPIPHKPGWTHSDPRMVNNLSAAGFTFMSCASNVSYPPSAALESKTVLDTHSILNAGVGKTISEARRPAIVSRCRLNFGLLSYTSVFWPVGHAASIDSPGVATLRVSTSYEPGKRALEMPGAPPTVRTAPNPEDLEALINDVMQLRSQVDLLVVAMHWGVSGSVQIAEYQAIVAHALVDAGADLILGTHPHVPQAIEVRHTPSNPNPGVIFYSLGNFVFDWRSMHSHRDGLLVKCMLDPERKQVVHVSFLPVRINALGQPQLLPISNGLGSEIVEKVSQLSDPYGTKLNYSWDTEDILVWSSVRLH